MDGNPRRGDYKAERQQDAHSPAARRGDWRDVELDGR